MHLTFLARGAAALALAFATGVPLASAQQAFAPASPLTYSVAVSASPVLRVNVRRGLVTIRTWNRPQISVASTAALTVRRFGPAQVTPQLQADLPIFAVTVQTLKGPVSLPAERFSLAGVAPGPHDAVDVRDAGAMGMPVIDVYIPSATALILGRVGVGRLTVDGYRGGTFVARVHTGKIFLRNVSGNGYAEVARGPIVATASAFGSLRARTAVGNIFFERCAANQIQVSSVNGSILYDDGSFRPGLASFESQHGNVAIGVASGGAQLAAHSSAGRIFSDFTSRTKVANDTATDAHATLDGGGPVVTASSGSGAVYLYDGAINTHRQLGAQWRPMHRLVQARARARRVQPRRIPPRRRVIHHRRLK